MRAVGAFRLFCYGAVPLMTLLALPFVTHRTVEALAAVGDGAT